MSDYIDTIRQSLFGNLKDKEYRDSFVESHLAANIASQIFATREAQDWTQEKLAQEAGMAQARIPLLEDPSYGSYTLKTLKRLASALDVALVVRFVPFSELVEWVVNLSPDELAVTEFENDAPRQAAVRVSAAHAKIPNPNDIPGLFQVNADALVQRTRGQTLNPPHSDIPLGIPPDRALQEVEVKAIEAHW